MAVLLMTPDNVARTSRLCSSGSGRTTERSACWPNNAHDRSIRQPTVQGALLRDPPRIGGRKTAIHRPQEVTLGRNASVGTLEIINRLSGLSICRDKQRMARKLRHLPPGFRRLCPWAYTRFAVKCARREGTRGAL